MLCQRELQTVTTDGRVLAGRSFGPADGQPILFVAGAATGKSMLFGDDLLEAMKLRIITMDRPGLGDSTPDPARTLESTAADYRSFVAAALGEKAAPIPVVANSQGAVFALKLASMGGTASLTLVSPADELAHPAIHAMLPPEATMLADLAQSAPEEAAAILGGFSAQAMEEMVISGSNADDASFYQAEPFLSLYRRGLAEGFMNDGSGYVTDTLIAMRSWQLDFDAISCPAQVLFGAGDLSHSPDHGETLTSRIPGASRTVFSDAGGALLWTHAKKILELASA
ncbi:alpha/beta hydrolase [Leucobacter sp. UT-8R-CII-1-4]|uniref:alpha/beta fold hydrolase n=1 Tax=Leucobacter sp. UT-8R-CII-1-4 TaxID=3040075 RepID=UPI0024A7D630|nr:alpha/beta hydrolase [Leucobacter sp. UT-8R-CII-1-4]MDI6022413.1 alpha/beta hydrolase [Leucobacter sp. UT-8R-CII-1-4]